MSSTKDCKTDLNTMRPLNPFDPDTFTTYEKAMETFACDQPKKGEEVSKEKVSEIPHESKAYGNSAYTLMPQLKTYALGVQALRDSFKGFEIPETHTYIKEDGRKIIRPLTFRETLMARLDDYFTEKDENGDERAKEDREKLFLSSWLDSCSGIAYKANSPKFKIIPQCSELIEISSDFNQHYLNIHYDALAGVELDINQDKYNLSLQKEEVLKHPGWLAAVEDDKVLLKDYTELVFALLKEREIKKSPMGFYVLTNLGHDQLHTLFVWNSHMGSDAGGNYNLDMGGSFLRVTPVIAKKVSIKDGGTKL